MNPYEALPALNLLTYQVSRMISDRLAAGVAIAEDEANIDYAFDLGGFFEHEADVQAFLDRLSGNEKYPFSTPELRWPRPQGRELRLSAPSTARGSGKRCQLLALEGIQGQIG